MQLVVEVSEWIGLAFEQSGTSQLICPVSVAPWSIWKINYCPQPNRTRWSVKRTICRFKKQSRRNLESIGDSLGPPGLPLPTALTYGCKSEIVWIDTVQDFLMKLGIKLCLHILKIRIFSLNHVIVRPIKIMNILLKVCKICTYFQSHFFGIKTQPNLNYFFFCEEYLTRRSTFINEIFWKLWFSKYTYLVPA